MVDAKLPAGRLAMLVEGAAAVAGQTDLTAVLWTTVETAMDLTDARYGALGVLGEHGTLIQFLHVGIDPDLAARIGDPPSGKGLLGTITRTTSTIRIDQLSAHPDFVGFPQDHPTMQTFLGLPIKIGEDVFGNLYLTEKVGGFTEDDEALIEALAVIAGSAISTARLQRRLRRVAVVEDRERIARDLHDAIIQDLFAVGLSLQSIAQRAPDPVLQAGLDEAVGRLDDSIASLRRFIFDLRPPVWTRRNLRVELSDLVAQLAGPYGADVELRVTDDATELPGAIVDDALQMIREALSNALRHSGASHIGVVVEEGVDTILISVTDDGDGFDPATVRKGMGLENLRSRADKAQGSTTISSTPGRGTTVLISLPL
jgi:signal transduction histidine kinase